MAGRPSLLDISDRVVVVFGATSGLGRALAVGLAEQGATVVPTGRRAERLSDVCREVEVASGKPSLVQAADVTGHACVEAFRDAVLERFGRVDVLVNAAGVTGRYATADLDEAEWARVLDTNLNGVLRTCQAFYVPLRDSGRGRIINIASLAAFRAFHEVAAYSASKAGVVSLTRSLGCEWAAEGICVNAIAPGVFPTDLNRELLEGTARGRELLMRTPAGRFGRPEELLGAAILLASDAASFMAGEIIAVDGGFLASGVNS